MMKPRAPAEQRLHQPLRQAASRVRKTMGSKGSLGSTHWISIVNADKPCRGIVHPPGPFQAPPLQTQLQGMWDKRMGWYECLIASLQAINPTSLTYECNCHSREVGDEQRQANLHVPRHVTADVQAGGRGCIQRKYASEQKSLIIRWNDSQQVLGKTRTCVRKHAWACALSNLFMGRPSTSKEMW